LPRFLTPGDEIQLGINVMNTTKNGTIAKPEIMLSGPIEMVPGESQSVSIAAGKEGVVYYTLKAKDDIGYGKVTVKVKSFGETFTDETDITIRPGSSLVKIFGEGAVAKNTTATIEMINDFIPSSMKTSLLVSSSPLAQYTCSLQNLLGYPHGCIEQTISKAFPQIYFADFIKATGNTNKVSMITSGDNDLNPVANVNAAINKLYSFQTYSGGLSYWPGENYVSQWASAYGLHFLVEAEKAGYEVNAGVKSKLVNYLNSISNNSMEERDWYYNNGKETARTIISREKIYALYTLALAGSPNRPAMNYCKLHLNKITTDSRYLLAAAFSYTGNQSSYQDVLPKMYVDDNNLQYLGGSFSSPLRNKALVLNTLIDKNMDNPQVISLARELSKNLKEEKYPNTQELAFSFLALGKIAKNKVKAGGKADIYAEENLLGTFSGKDLKITKGFGNGTSIRSNGTADVYYFWTAQGISKSGKVVEEDNGMKVRKAFYNRNHEVISLASVKQNDLVIVKITLASSYATTLNNIVITDILPAGFEIENPRITPEKDLSWTNDQSYSDHFDIRDDRINYFVDLYQDRPLTFYYMVRAVSKGKFKMGPVSADAMYDGSIHSYSGAGVLLVD
ncbi:MAG: alpha-2-macroglobulin family protein, partial [Bacteroidia bacterium]|nr:alpha-2-macroglobulin family protein [Bacteroidia bacterium]